MHTHWSVWVCGSSFSICLYIFYVIVLCLSRNTRIHARSMRQWINKNTNCGCSHTWCGVVVMVMVMVTHTGVRYEHAVSVPGGQFHGQVPRISQVVLHAWCCMILQYGAVFNAAQYFQHGVGYRTGCCNMVEVMVTTLRACVRVCMCVCECVCLCVCVCVCVFWFVRHTSITPGI